MQHKYFNKKFKWFVVSNQNELMLIKGWPHVTIKENNGLKPQQKSILL